MPSEFPLPDMSVDELTIYFQAVHEATFMLKPRMARLGECAGPAVREVSRFQAMVKQYHEAMLRTRQLGSSQPE